MADEYARDQERLQDLMREQAELVNKTIERNLDLHDKIKNLEREIGVWKQAHATADEERKVLSARMNSVDPTGDAKASAKVDGTSLTFCLIDGDANVFSDGLLVQGVAGGKKAAQMLARSISGDEANVPGARAHQTWTLVYYDRSALRERCWCTPEQFDGFMQGFNQSFDLFSIIDVGPGRDGADQKIKAYLRTFARIAQIQRVVLCGAPEGHYRPLFRILENEGLMSKLSILRGSHEPSADIAQLHLPTIEARSLFASPVPSAAASPPKTPSTAVSAAELAERMAASPAFPPGLGAFAGAQREPMPRRQTNSTIPARTPQYLDPSLPISKQQPPPCNFFYLARCNKPLDKCQYSHSYTLTDPQLKELRHMAKRSPCMTVNRNFVCPNGEDCCLGHACPNGPNCSYYRAGKCKFTGNDMHSPVNHETIY